MAFPLKYMSFVVWEFPYTKSNICWIVIITPDSWNWDYFCDATDWYGILFITLQRMIKY